MRTDIAEILIDIEAELRQLDLWGSSTPSSEALASIEPFCIDTLTLPQWLQFVFLPTLQRLLKEQQRLPERCGIAPIAEEYFSGSALNVAGLVYALRRIDTLLSDG
jgi:uncharacterized protein YqcC (DUF446 family)